MLLFSISSSSSKFVVKSAIQDTHSFSYSEWEREIRLNWDRHSAQHTGDKCFPKKEMANLVVFYSSDPETEIVMAGAVDVRNAQAVQGKKKDLFVSWG